MYNELLKEEGLRIAESYEAGWYYAVWVDGKKTTLWVTDD